jgi:hypothetical protein
VVKPEIDVVLATIPSRSTGKRSSASASTARAASSSVNDATTSVGRTGGVGADTSARIWSGDSIGGVSGSRGMPS